MLGSFQKFKKWQKVDDLPPIVDEIGFLENENINQGNIIHQGVENILIFLSLEKFQIIELKAEIIDLSQIVKEFFKKMCKKYLPSINTNQVYMKIDGNFLSEEDNNKQFKHIKIKSNSIIKFKKRKIIQQHWFDSFLPWNRGAPLCSPCPQIMMNEESQQQHQQSDQPITDNITNIRSEQPISQSQNTNHKITISIIHNGREKELEYNQNDNQTTIYRLLEYAVNDSDFKNNLILCNGDPISSLKDISDLKNVKSIMKIDLAFGGMIVKFTKEINDKNIENLSQLQDSLKWLNNSEINQFIQENLNEINQQQKYDYQYVPLHCIIAIRLYTSNLIFRKLNQDLKTSNYNNWKGYLKCLMEGLRYMKYYKGVGYRGISNYQNTTDYQKGKIVLWSGVTSISLQYKVAQNFSNRQGMIFKLDLISAKEIANISIFEGEQEVLLNPFSSFVIDEVQVNSDQPHLITIRELPQPRSNQVLLWVDDRPEKNYYYAQDLEIQNRKISVIFCTSTKEAILIIQKYQWMIYLSSSLFRIISDMVRIEDGKENYNAGIELLSYLYQKMKYKNSTLIFCGDKNRAQEECQKQNIQGNFQITNDVLIMKKFIQFE